MIASFIHAAWHFVTRLGEAQILLPAMAVASLWLALAARSARLAATWWACTAVATLLTTATKVAFIGWGVGSGGWNFTGLSGHAMFAAAVLPLLARLALGRLPPPWPRWGLVLGVALAAVIAVSRVRTGAHSWSEALLGFLVGTAATAATLRLARVPAGGLPRWVLPALLMGFVLAMGHAPRSHTHDWVTALSLRLSGHAAPYTRQQMLRDYQHPQAPRP